VSKHVFICKWILGFLEDPSPPRKKNKKGKKKNKQQKENEQTKEERKTKTKKENV